MNAEQAIYEAYFNLKQSKLYFSQLKEYTNLSHSSLQNTLDRMIKNNILKREKTKSNTFYKIKNKKIFALRFSEIAINKFESLNKGVRIPLRNFLKDIPLEIFTIVLFGSASRKQEHEGSDIDILVVSKDELNLIKNKKEGELVSNYPINIFQTNIADFINDNDEIIIQAKKTGFPIYKEQSFYEVVLNEY